MSNMPFTFDPRKKGLRKFLGETEYPIMEALWQGGEFSVRDVCTALQRKREIAYTTVMTVMCRLFEKGLLWRRKEGKSYIYQAAVSREDLTRSIVGRVIGGLLSDFTAPAISQFVDSVDEQRPEEMEELARLIAEKRRQKDG